MSNEANKKKTGHNLWSLFIVAAVVAVIGFCVGSFYHSSFGAGAMGAKVFTKGTVPPSLTSNDVLLANNQVISQVGTMYQHFGLFITSIVALSGALITYMGSMAKKSVDDFMTEWKEKLKVIEDDIKTSQEKFRVCLADIEKSKENIEETEQAIYKILEARSNPSNSDIVISESEETNQVDAGVSAALAQIEETNNG